MIDSDIHAYLIDAANEAGWDEETMLLMAVRFIDGLATTNPEVETQFQDYLTEQVQAESDEDVSGIDCPR